MNKCKRFVLLLLVGVISLMIVGCTSESKVTMDKSGKGSVVYQFSFKKNSVEDDNYTKFNSLEELANVLQELIDPETNLKVSIDRTSSEDKDYIVITSDFNSVEEYNKNVDKVLEKYNQLVVAEDMNGGMFGEISSQDGKTTQMQIEALKEYLEENGIEIGENDRNLRKFNKILTKDLYLDEYFEEEEFFDKKDFEEMPNVVIEDRDGDTFLKIHLLAYDYIDMYMRRLVETNAEKILNLDYIQENYYIKNSELVRRLFKGACEKLDLAATIKSALDTKFNNNVSKYSMNDFSPVLAAKLVTDDYREKFNTEYNRQYKEYKKEQEANKVEEAVDLNDVLYGEQNLTYNFTFGENQAVISSDDIYKYTDQDGYIVLNGKKDSGISLKDANNVDSADLDETPWSGDNFHMLLIGGMIVL